MKNLFIIFLLFLPLSFFAQNKFKILDSRSREPLEGVSVSVKTRGVQTDVEGSFDLKNLSPISNNDTLKLTLIGYYSLSISVSDLKQVPQGIVYLKQQDEWIDQVVVSARGRDKLDEVPYVKLASMKVPVYAFGVVEADGKIYVQGGDNSTKDKLYDYSEFENNIGAMQVYDIVTDTWTLLDNKFTNRAYHNAIYNDGKIYLLGGKKIAKNPKLEYLVNEVEAYDIARDTVFVSKVNPHQGINFASGISENNIIVMGGAVSETHVGKKFSKKSHVFDTKTGYWYSLDDMPQAKEAKGILVDSVMYLVGGHSTATVTDFYSYNIQTEKYDIICSINSVFDRPAIAYANGIVYIHEGDTLYTYNVKTKRMEACVLSLGLQYHDMICKDGMLYIMGGYRLTERHIAPSKNVFSVDLEIVDSAQKMPSSDVYSVDLNMINATKVKMESAM